MTPEYLALVHARNPDGTPLLPGLRVACLKPTNNAQVHMLRAEDGGYVQHLSAGCLGYQPAEESLETVMMALARDGWKVTIWNRKLVWFAALTDEHLGVSESPLVATLSSAIKAFGLDVKEARDGR